MNFDPPIENLPFTLQRHILGFRPRLPRLRGFHLLRNHFKDRYCAVCGEYLDYIPCVQNSGYPLHLHPKQKKYRFTMNKYYCFYPTPFLHLRNIPNLHSVSVRVYHTLNYDSNRLPFKIFCRIQSPHYFFSMRYFLNQKKKYLLPMINLLNINIFKNPCSYLALHFPEDTDYLNTNWFFFDRHREFIDGGSSRHMDRIQKILFGIVDIYDMYPRIVMALHGVLQSNEAVIQEFARQRPFELMMLYGSCTKCNHDDLFFIAILANIHILEFIPQRKISQLSMQNPYFFAELLRNNPGASNYLYAYDPVLDTLGQRLEILMEA